MNRPPTPNEIEGAARAASNSAAPNSGASESDADLVQAARRGDKRAFIEIVTRYQPMVCAVTLGILNHFAASEDAAQEAFLAAWRKFHELREPERLRSWLGQIARNAALGHLRRLRGHDTLTPVPSLADEAPGPDEAAATEEEATLVRDALAKLPENYRLPLVLFYRDNQSVRAVAEALDISEDAVKQRLARGREMLRDRIAGVIGEVLTRTGPKARFTIAIAAAIGALAAPAAVAGSIFAATTTTTAAVSASASATVTTSSTASPSASLLTAMSTSKGFLAMTALVAVFCIPVGYQLSTAKTSLASGSAAAAGLTSGQTNLEARTPSFEDSAFFAAWRELHEKHGTNAQAMPALYKAIAGLSEPFRRRAFRSALIAEWVQVEPTNGLAFFLGKGVDEAQRRQFFEEWLARDARVAVDALLASPSGWEEMARDCLPEIARRLPARLAEIASRLPAPESYYDTNVRDAFGILAADNLVSARQAAERVTGPSREQALGGVAQVWAKNELEGAVAWAKGLGTERDEVIRHALLGKASVDPVAALELAGIVPSGGRHAHGESTTGARVLGEAAKTDFDATVNWLIAHPGRFGHEDLMGLSQAVTTRLNAGVAAFLNGRLKDGSLAALMPALESALLNLSLIHI